MVTASTKPALRRETYAQNLCCGAARPGMCAGERYQSHSAAKSLIHIASLNCFFSGQSGKTLDLQGFGRFEGDLSTKLSTEKSKISKAPSNQALRALFASVYVAMATSAYPS
ncbi:hypothetical protein [Polaromonas sp.]|uniref:hypothetical protein n=1 Tax=Polaromonas sp. TaxID=1869339 RepID=UPI0025DAB164|nr:hypothetical protein [Polaromonas sp.]